MTVRGTARLEAQITAGLLLAFVLVLIASVLAQHGHEHGRVEQHPAVPSSSPTAVAPRPVPTTASRSRTLPGGLGGQSKGALRRSEAGTSRATGSRHPDWAVLADCESSGDPHAVSPNGLYFGLYQFDAQTWLSVGGTGNPANATPAEQTHRAQLLYAARSTQPWPVCGRHL